MPAHRVGCHAPPPGSIARRRLHALALLMAACLLVPAPAARASHDPNRTVTVCVHGFDLAGADRHGTFGEDVVPALAESIAALVGLPVVREPNGPLPGNVVSGTTYYGDLPPSYYSAADRAELDRITGEFGGGVPRYAFIVARYARRVLERSGADQLNFVSGSFGSLIVRWIIEKDVCGLAGEGRIARWLTVEGLVAGNWAASQDLAELVSAIAPEPIDVQHMRYDWVESHLHAPRTEAASPAYGGILIGQVASTDDRGTGGALRDAMLIDQAYQPNDGVQSLPDARFTTVAAPARYAGLAPTLAVFHTDHLGILRTRAAWAEAVTFLTASRRVTVTLTKAAVANLHEPQQPWWDWRPAEILFESRAYSPAAEERWGAVGPLCSWVKEGASPPLRRYRNNGEVQPLEQVLFDDLVLPEETELRIDLRATEVDFDPRYGVFETAQSPAYDDLGGGTLVVSTRQPGTYAFAAGDWSGEVTVALHDYPFAELTAVPPVTLSRSERALALAPNPSRTAVRITAPPAADLRPEEPATLEIVDVTGRILRRMDGLLAEGFVWDGRDAAGRPVRAGVFLARVTTARGTWSVRGCRLR